MSKVLVVVYSYTGTGRRVAQMLCSGQNWPLAEISDTQPRQGGMGALRCVLDSLFKRKPPIAYTGPEPRDFDTVVLVAPIWAGRLAGPMRSFVASWRERLHAVAVVSLMGGRGAPNAVAEIGRLMGRSPVLNTAFTQHEVDDGSYCARLCAFGGAVQAMQEERAPVRPVTLSPRAA